MKRKSLIIFINIGLILFFTVAPISEAPYYYRSDEHYHQGSIWLCLYSRQITDTPSLIFGNIGNAHYISTGDMTFEEYSNLYEQYFPEDSSWYGDLEIPPNESLTFSITGVEDRIYNPDIDIFMDIIWRTDGSESSINISYQLRFDGDNDGEFEYIINFPENPDWRNNIINPISTIGEPINMTDGTIELVISRTDNTQNTYTISFSDDYSYFQVPFDLDTDNDGVGDFSDFDDDNDGHTDIDDFFMRNPNEWKDSDVDGIGDNEDEDDNGNNIPDIFEIPIAVVIILIPIIIIIIILKRKKKSKNNESDINKE